MPLRMPKQYSGLTVFTISARAFLPQPGMTKAVYLHIDMHENQSMNYQSEFSISTHKCGI